MINIYVINIYTFYTYTFGLRIPNIYAIKTIIILYQCTFVVQQDSGGALANVIFRVEDL